MGIPFCSTERCHHSSCITSAHHHFVAPLCNMTMSTHSKAKGESPKAAHKAAALKKKKGTPKKGASKKVRARRRLWLGAAVLLEFQHCALHTCWNFSNMQPKFCWISSNLLVVGLALFCWNFSTATLHSRWNFSNSRATFDEIPASPLTLSQLYSHCIARPPNIMGTKAKHPKARSRLRSPHLRRKISRPFTRKPKRCSLPTPT